MTIRVETNVHLPLAAGKPVVRHVYRLCRPPLPLYWRSMHEDFS
jgi:hypothetical protein